MISATLAKLIDEAILPGLVLVLGKFLGVILVAKIISAEFKMTSGEFFFPNFTFTNFSAYYTVNSYSNLVMFAAVGMGAAFILARAHFFHASHITPKMHVRLLRLGLTGLIAETYQLYHQAVVWLIFLWLATILVLTQAFFSLSNPIIAIVAFLVTLNFSWFLVADIELEVEIFRQRRYLR